MEVLSPCNQMVVFTKKKKISVKHHCPGRFKKFEVAIRRIIKTSVELQINMHISRDKFIANQIYMQAEKSTLRKLMKVLFLGLTGIKV